MKNILRRLVPSFNRNQIFEIDYKVLTLVGFRPDKMVNLRSMSIFILCLLLEVLPEFYFIVKHKHDVQAVFMCLHEFVSLLVFVLKTFVFFFNRHNLAKLITGLTTEWSNCEFDKEKFLIIFMKAFSGAYKNISFNFLQKLLKNPTLDGTTLAKNWKN